MISNAKWLLARDGELIVTLPEQFNVTPAALEALWLLHCLDRSERSLAKSVASI
jgi:hypothetical protein